MTDQPYGDREGSVLDPLRNHWYIATHQATGLAPEGLRTITPYLHVAGADRVLEFVEHAFGGEVLARDQSPDGIIHHAKMRLGDSIVELGEAHDTEVNYYCSFADASECDRLRPDALHP